MAFRRITCIIAVCDIPGRGNSADPDGATAHFDTETEAAENTLADPDCYANVWHRRPDGRLVFWRRDPARPRRFERHLHLTTQSSSRRQGRPACDAVHRPAVWSYPFRSRGALLSGCEP
ncbi:hypothetical protein ACWDHW_08470 [Streptomyces melanosporofaciens]